VNLIKTGTANEQLVSDFFEGMGPTLDAFRQTFREYMADDVVWESVGFDRHEGLEDCVAYLDTLNQLTGMEYCTIEVLHIASAGDVVLTERVDKMFRKDGSLILDFRIMGALEVRDGKIVRYTDYLDTMMTARTLERLAAEMGHDRNVG
jgi:limonene-1,2-epoxide hydrolase